MTFQKADILKIKMQRIGTYSYPLNSYPGTAKKFPFVSTNCWNGYVATWKLRKNCLYLMDIRETAMGNVGVQYLFPGKKWVRARWFDGEIKIRNYKETTDAYNPGYIIFNFSKGILVKERTIQECLRTNPKLSEFDTAVL